MNRRSVIKNIAWVIGAATLAPSCLNRSSNTFTVLKNMPLNEEDQSLIAEICETIIPKTQSPGAKELNLPQFVLKMLDETVPSLDQKKFLLGFSEFKSFVQKKSGKAYFDLDSKDREALLTGIESSKPKMETKNLDKKENKVELSPIHTFYFALKSQTLFAYTTSQYFMTKEVIYELVPGRYKVHFPIKNIKNA